jgi:protein-arginine kinase activator protein McsA
MEEDIESIEEGEKILYCDSCGINVYYISILVNGSERLLCKECYKAEVNALKDSMPA